jgi:hypothetical protein
MLQRPNFGRVSMLATRRGFWRLQILSSFLKGHCKTGHAGSLQNRPWEGSRNLDVVLCHSLFGQV